MKRNNRCGGRIGKPDRPLIQGVLAMEYHGTIQNGVVVFDNPQPLPEGLKVKVVVEETEAGQPTLLNLLNHAGALPDMPSDFAEEHDHYIHGTPKR